MPVEVVLSYGDWVKVRDATGDMAWTEAKALSARRNVIVRMRRRQSARARRTTVRAVVMTAEKNVLLELVDPDSRHMGTGHAIAMASAATSKLPTSGASEPVLPCTNRNHPKTSPSSAPAPGAPRVAIALAARHDVLLWGRNAAPCAQAASARENTALPARLSRCRDALRVTADFDAALAHVLDAAAGPACRC